MSPHVAPDACFLTAAYLCRDGTWYCEHLQVQVVVAVVNVLPSPQSIRPRPDSEDEEAGTSVLRFSAQSSREVFRAMCTSRLGDENTLQLEKDLVVRLRKIPSLSSCRVEDGQRFGKLTHWSRLLKQTRAPNIVVFSTSHNRFSWSRRRAQIRRKPYTFPPLCVGCAREPGSASRLIKTEACFVFMSLAGEA